jgi:hypothetical protein
MGPITLTESVPTAQVDGWQCEWQVGRLIRVFPGNVQKPWFPGSRNIEVTWTAGYNPVPPTYKKATLELVKYWWINEQQNAGITSAPGVSGDYDQADQSSNAGLWAGVPDRIKMMLEPRPTIGIG